MGGHDMIQEWPEHWANADAEKDNLPNDYDLSDAISHMTFNDKVNALIKEGGYTRKEAIETLEEMGE